jgi:hypothetical protein
MSYCKKLIIGLHKEKAKPSAYVLSVTIGRTVLRANFPTDRNGLRRAVRARNNAIHMLLLHPYTRAVSFLAQISRK